MAAGFTIKAENIEEFRYRLNNYAAEFLSDEDLGRTLTADAEMSLEDVTIAMIKDLSRMEPHGIGNATPLFLMRHLPIRSVNTLKEKHLKINVGKVGKTLEAVWWNSAQFSSQLENADSLSLLCRPEINEWKGRTTIQLKIVDAAIE